MRDAHFLADEQLGAELEQQLVEKVIQQAVEIMARDRDRHQVLGTEIDRSKISHVAEHADCLLLKGLSERAPPYMMQQAAQSARACQGQRRSWSGGSEEHIQECTCTSCGARYDIALVVVMLVSWHNRASKQQ